MNARQLVVDLLQEYGASARARLFEYLPAAEPWRYLYGPAADYPGRGGRAFRPSLCIATARAFGASTADALLTAVSIEMMHNAMLIHDDIEDESEQRRGRPTLHRQEGLPIALNAGDMLALLSMRPLLDNLERLGPWLSLRLLEETERMARESAEGQALELGWRRDNVGELREEDYLTMVLKKTCWLVAIHPCRAGALIGGAAPEVLEAMVRFGFFLGAAFQIQDDLLNLEGDADRYGKELGGDVYEGKRTLMLIRLLERATPAERARCRELLALPRERRAKRDVAWVHSRMEHHGCIDYARRVAHGLAGAARHEIGRLCDRLPPSRDRTFLETLPVWVLART